MTSAKRIELNQNLAQINSSSSVSLINVVLVSDLTILLKILIINKFADKFEKSIKK